VRIARFVGVLVMDAMRADPGNGAAFERQCSANREEIFERQRYHEGTMSVQAMVAQADPEAGTHPVQYRSLKKNLPTEKE